MTKTNANLQEQKWSAKEVRNILHEAGADDVGFVGMERPEVDGDREDILQAFPRARTLISFVVRMNPDAVRSVARSIANTEFHRAVDETREIGVRALLRLSERGTRGINPSAGFPMEADRFPGKMWVLSHKTIAMAAGLGRLGLNRMLIHPRLGNFILLGTLITDLRVEEEAEPLDFNPCVDCKLCVAACPVGAISPGGHFNFISCMTHNYREFMGGFSDWTETVIESKNARAYRKKVSDAESTSWWQSLSYGPNYKAAYCMGVCPAGEDMIGLYTSDKKSYLEEIVRPLQEKQETVYVLPHSDAEEHVQKRFPQKTSKQIGNGIRLRNMRAFEIGMPLAFQPGRAKKLGLSAAYHFTFTGEESGKMTVRIQDGELNVESGHAGRADVRVRADGRAWLAMLAGERSKVGLVLTGKMRVRGSLKLLARFSECFAM